MSTAHDLALRLAVHKVLADQLKGVRGELDEQARQVMEPGDRVTAKLPSGERVGSVTLAQGRVTARVVDERAFTAWVAEHYPHELVQAVRESFKRTVLDMVRNEGGWLDKTTGELVTVPGVTVAEGDPYPTVRLTQDAQQLVARAWQSGELAGVLGDVLQPAIEAGEAS